MQGHRLRRRAAVWRRAMPCPPLQRDRHQVRTGAEDSGKAVLDRSRSAYEVEQNLTLFARQEERLAEGRNRGPLGIRYDAPSHLRKRHAVDRNDFIPRPARVEPT